MNETNNNCANHKKKVKTKKKKKSKFILPKNEVKNIIVSYLSIVLYLFANKLIRSWHDSFKCMADNRPSPPSPTCKDTCPRQKLSPIASRYSNWHAFRTDIGSEIV